MTFKQRRLNSQEISDRTYAEYKATCERIDKRFGSNRLIIDLGPDDFAKLRDSIAKQWGPVRLSNEIQRIRSVFKFAMDSRLIDRVVHFGPEFKKPSAGTLRKERAKKGKRQLASDQIHKLLAVAGSQMKAIILLAINGGLGNTDIALLTETVFDLDGGWLDYPRPKTGIPRRIPLWSETVAAVREAIVNRRQPKNQADNKFIFIGRRGHSYVSSTGGWHMAHEFTRLCEKAKINGRCFYDLRRTFETIADNRSRDRDGVKAIMGHAPASGDMTAVYRQEFDDSRLRSIVNHVHDWLYQATADG